MIKKNINKRKKITAKNYKEKHTLIGVLVYTWSIIKRKKKIIKK